MTTALNRFQHRLKQVTLYVQDVNGPKGGIDKHVRCVLHLRRMQPIVINDKDDNMTSLLHRVANRAAHVLSKRANRSARQVKKQRVERNDVSHVEDREFDDSELTFIAS